MQEIWHRIENWLRENAPSVLETLQAGADEQSVREAEAILGIELPNDMKESLRIHNGQKQDPFYGGVIGLIDACELLSIEGIIECWTSLRKQLGRGDFSGIRSSPRPGIRDDWWNPKWIPLTYDGQGNHYCIDLAPASDGTLGQIITFWHDDGIRRTLATSFETWLSDYADGFEAGYFVLSGEIGGLIRKEDL